MKQLKMTLIAITLGTAGAYANAGIWDDITGFFGSSEETTEQAAETNTSSALVTTGMQLLPLLTQQLGINLDQAKGGMGALLQTAQLLMPTTDFSKISQAIPNATSLLQAAPTLADDSSSGGLMADAMMLASDSSPTAKAAMDLTSQFKSLGMGADMIPKFTDVAGSYLQQNDNTEAGNLLTSALSSFL